MGDAAPVAISGATGQVGSRVVRRLAAVGVATRALVRDLQRGADLPGERAVITDFLDPNAAESLRGCRSLFLVSARESANRVAEHRAMVDAAVETGVESVVYLSFQGAAADCTFTFGRDHWHTEQYIRSTGLAYAFLRDSFYLAQLPALADASGIIRGPAGRGAVAAVSHDDVAAVAAAVLSDDTLRGVSYDVTGPEALTLSEAAAVISEVSGRPVRYVEETVEEAYASRAHYGAPAFEVAGWVSSYESIAQGEVATVSDTVATLTGEQPIGLRAYLERYPESWQHLVQ